MPENPYAPTQPPEEPIPPQKHAFWDTSFWCGAAFLALGCAGPLIRFPVLPTVGLSAALFVTAAFGSGTYRNQAVVALAICLIIIGYFAMAPA